MRIHLVIMLLVGACLSKEEATRPNPCASYADGVCPDAGNTDADGEGAGNKGADRWNADSTDTGNTDTDSDDAGNTDTDSENADNTDTDSENADSTDTDSENAGNTDTGNTDTDSDDADNTDRENADSESAGNTDAADTDAGTSSLPQPYVYFVDANGYRVGFLLHPWDTAYQTSMTARITYGSFAFTAQADNSFTLQLPVTLRYRLEGQEHCWQATLTETQLSHRLGADDFARDANGARMIKDVAMPKLLKMQSGTGGCS